MSFGEDLLRSPDVTDENGQELSPHNAWSVGGGLRATDTGTSILLTGDAPGGAIKAPVRAASTANLTLSAPGATIDGVTMVADDRVLVKNQSSAPTNGVYIWNGAASAMTRASDFDGAGDAYAGAIVMVQEGTANGDTLWTLTTNGAITIGSTSLAFGNLSGAAGISYIADVTPAPTTPPASGVILYSFGGNLYALSSSGVTTQLTP